MAEYLEVGEQRRFPLIRPLVGFKAQMQEQLDRFPFHQNVFLMMKFRDSNRELSEFIIDELDRHGYRGVRADQPAWNITRNVYNPIASLYCCRYGLALFDQPEAQHAYSPNVAYELGMMHYQDKNCLILKHSSLRPVPFDLVKDLYQEYTSDVEIRRIIAQWVESLGSPGLDSAFDVALEDTEPPTPDLAVRNPGMHVLRALALLEDDSEDKLHLCRNVAERAGFPVVRTRELLKKLKRTGHVDSAAVTGEAEPRFRLTPKGTRSLMRQGIL